MDVLVFFIMDKLKVGTWFTGIGAPEQAIKELGIPHRNVMAAEWDKYAAKTYLANFAPEQMFGDVTKVDCASIEPLDLFIAGFPCQAFSIAGKRLGFEETRGTLFFNCAEFIRINQPKYFILENVKGLLSHDKPKGSKSKHGRTFNTILNLLARTVNYQETMFPYDDNLGYNIHYQVLNSKNYGVPQNRERVFIIGIRPDLPNDYHFPKGWILDKRLKHILEPVVDEKYYLSEKILAGFQRHNENHKKKGTGFIFDPKTGEDVATCIRASGALGATDNSVIVDEPGCIQFGRTEEAKKIRKENMKNGVDYTPFSEKEITGINTEVMNTVVTNPNKDNLIYEPEIKRAGQIDGFESAGRVYDTDGISPTVTAKQGGGHEPFIQEGDEVVCHNMQPRSADRPSLKYSSGGSGHLQREDGLTYCLDTGATNAVEVKGTGRIRRLTPLECMRLQGFPDTYITPCSDSQRYKMAGNSITVSVIKAVIGALPFMRDVSPKE